MSPNRLIFDKSDPVRLRTKECKNLSHMLKLKSSKVMWISPQTLRAHHKVQSEGIERSIEWTRLQISAKAKLGDSLEH